MKINSNTKTITKILIVIEKNQIMIITIKKLINQMVKISKIIQIGKNNIITINIKGKIIQMI